MIPVQNSKGPRPISIETLLVGVMCVGLFGAILTLPDPRTVSSYSSSFAAWDQVRHFAAMPNCAAARAVGLAPSYPWRPGYWKAHDRDGDGVSCEPIPKWKRR
ncbi:excalibur calcium-binding domain-containing protein [Brevundimonas sp.]|uniref:excalibur calcium-binding domain-containing protein n=1 Tax=Brevundimonas sp. TaxID=1871086 RepID=UPI00351CC2EF